MQKLKKIIPKAQPAKRPMPSRSFPKPLKKLVPMKKIIPSQKKYYA